jgi:prepilin-type N-terminal cleavage/methylation domain-containing protein
MIIFLGKAVRSMSPDTAIRRMAYSPKCVRLSQDKRGFTLLETMVALAIFTVGILGIGAMLVYSTRSRVFNRQLNFAVTLAHAKMEDLRKVGTSEIDIRYSSVLNFNYLLSRKPDYGTIQGYPLPGLLSGAAGLADAKTKLLAKLGFATEAAAAGDPEYNKRLDSIKIMYDDGDMDNHGDETAGDGIWSSLEYINADTQVIKTPERYNALSASEKEEWNWIILRRTTLEPVNIDKIAENDSRRTISHATLSANPADTTGADVARIFVECSWLDIKRKEWKINFQTLIVRSSM